MNLSESFKSRMRKLAGIINEEMSVGPDGSISGISPSGQIPGDKIFVYAITYENVTPESAEQGDADSRGYEIEHTHDTLEEIIYLGRNTYGTNEPSSSHPHAGMWWSSSDPVQNRDYWEKGINKYYSLHVKNSDGTDLDAEQSAFITKLLTSEQRLKWDEDDNMWR
jgi:hypothetical protein